MKFFDDNRVSTDQDLDKINEVTRSSRYQKFTKLGFLWLLYNLSWNLHIDGVHLSSSITSAWPAFLKPNGVNVSKVYVCVAYAPAQLLIE